MDAVIGVHQKVIRIEGTRTTPINHENGEPCRVELELLCDGLWRAQWIDLSFGESESFCLFGPVVKRDYAGGFFPSYNYVYKLYMID